MSIQKHACTDLPLLGDRKKKSMTEKAQKMHLECSTLILESGTLRSTADSHAGGMPCGSMGNVSKTYFYSKKTVAHDAFSLSCKLKHVISKT